MAAAAEEAQAISPQEAWTSRIQSAIAASRKISGGNYVTLATVDSDGRPHCRTVVFRGFVKIADKPGEQALKIITDARSEKVAHAAHSPACEVTWWFSQTSEQYRFEGSLQFVHSDAEGELQAARQEQWQKLSDPAREQFWWDQPGVAYTGKPNVPVGGRDEDGHILPPPANFCLGLIWPHKVKYLRLGDNHAEVDEFEQASAKWRPTRVNP